MSWITETTDGIIITVRVIPRASRNQVEGLHGDAVKVRLKAPPVDGKANDALIEYLSDTLGIPRRNITLLSGQTSRQKRLAIAGITVEAAVKVMIPS